MSDQKKSRRFNPTKWVMSIIGLAILAWGCYETVALITDHRSNITSDDAQVEQYISPINVKVPGYIREIRFSEHQFVHKGDTLLVIDDREYRIQVKQAEANLKDAYGGGNVVEATVDRVAVGSQVYDSSIAEIEVRLQKLRTDLARYQNLLERDAATPVQVEQIETEIKATEAKLAAAKQQKATAQSSITEASTRRQNTDAAVLRAKAALEMAQLNLSYTVITAPCDGYIGRRAIEEGQLVNAGQTITNIMPNSDKWIIANFKETQIKDLRQGQAVEITIDAFPDKVFTGRISRIASATGAKYSQVPTDNSAGNFVKIQQRVPVRIEFVGLSDADNAQMAAGMMAVVKVNRPNGK